MIDTEGGKLPYSFSLSHSLALSLSLTCRTFRWAIQVFFLPIFSSLFCQAYLSTQGDITYEALYLIECFRKKPMITFFSSLCHLCVYSCVYTYVTKTPKKIRERFIGRGEHGAETMHDKLTWRKSEWERERAKRNRINHWLELNFTNQLSFQGHFIDIPNESCIDKFVWPICLCLIELKEKEKLKHGVRIFFLFDYYWWWESRRKKIQINKKKEKKAKKIKNIEHRHDCCCCCCCC